ncbi:MAG: hypothetical protein ACRYE9_04385 [Janthinobacterium lividum]
MEQKLEDDKIEDMVEMELENYVKEFEQTGGEPEGSYMDIDSVEDDSNYMFDNYMSGEDEIDPEDYIIESEMENECNNQTRG